VTMTPWPFAILTCLVGLFTVAGCEVGSCGGSAGASDVCPPAVYGYGLVWGQVLRSDGSPAAGKQTYVSCGDVVGSWDARTDADGRFEVRPVYAVMDTLLYPFPPREPNGSFDLSCQAGLLLAQDLVIRKNPLVVRFTPTREAVVTTTVELREGET
jgi:hypothetical protein